VPDSRLFPRGRDAAPLLLPFVLVDRRRRAAWGPLARALRDGGADALELGFPFSDPIADGPVLEAAAVRALAHGTRWSDLLDALRATSPVLPTAVMTYANPVWHRGLRDGCRELSDGGASGLVVPDLSLEESAPWSSAAVASGLDLPLFAAPGVPRDRMASIARRSRGFLYLVSRYGTTGNGRNGVAPELASLVRAAHRTSPELPVLLGFGVRNRSTAAEALRTGADGVIVGTALEEAMAGGRNPGRLARWLRALRPPPAIRMR
jgi:tryptophan synthase alpha chain